MDFIKLEVGDIIELRKPHPCGNALFAVTRTGVDIKIRCQKCGRPVMDSRERLLKKIKTLHKKPETEKTEN